MSDREARESSEAPVRVSVARALELERMFPSLDLLAMAQAQTESSENTTSSSVQQPPLPGALDEGRHAQDSTLTEIAPEHNSQDVHGAGLAGAVSDNELNASGQAVIAPGGVIGDENPAIVQSTEISNSNGPREHQAADVNMLQRNDQSLREAVTPPPVQPSNENQARALADQLEGVHLATTSSATPQEPFHPHPQPPPVPRRRDTELEEQWPLKSIAWPPLPPPPSGEHSDIVPSGSHIKVICQNRNGPCSLIALCECES